MNLKLGSCFRSLNCVFHQNCQSKSLSISSFLRVPHLSAASTSDSAWLLSKLFDHLGPASPDHHRGPRLQPAEASYSDLPFHWQLVQRLYIINYNKLIEKLLATFLHPNLKMWVAAYLMDHRVRVLYQGVPSMWKKQKMGDPKALSSVRPHSASSSPHLSHQLKSALPVLTTTMPPPRKLTLTPSPTTCQ